MKTAKMTMDQVFTEASGKLSTEIGNLNARRNQSLNIFRKTAQDLEGINAELTTAIGQMDDLVAVIEANKNVANKTIADNSRVIAHIYDIIGN